MQNIKFDISLLLYGISIRIHYFLIGIFSIYHWKARKWINYRMGWEKKLECKLDRSKERIWICCPSIGEYQECRIFVKRILESMKNAQVIITFYSPSGYDQAVIPGTDYIKLMLPLDTKGNAKKFISLVQPRKAFFLASGIWPNYILTLQQDKIPHYLISFHGRASSSFFRKQLKFFYKVLFASFSTIFCYNEDGKELLLSHFGYRNAIPINNMRFDSILDMKKETKTIDGISDFIDNKFCFIAGSTEQKENEIILEAYEKLKMLDMKWIIVPHEKLRSTLTWFSKKLGSKACFYKRGIDNSRKVLIYDITGDLFQLYQYANISLVGRGFSKKEIHNMIEPAVYAIPVIIGPMHKKFIEPELFINEKLAFEFGNSEELAGILKGFYYGHSKIDKMKTQGIFNKYAGGIERVMDKLVDCSV